MQPTHLNPVAPAAPQKIEARAPIAIVLPKEAIKIDVDTPTDWPAVFVPFVLGAIGIYFAKVSQSQQIRSSTANFRNAWLQEVRNAAVDFGTSAMEIQLNCGKNPQFMTSDRAFELTNGMLVARTKLMLMLDENKEYTARVSEAITNVIRESRRYSDDFNAALVEFERASRVVLESA
jgi:hypothetical protein